LATLLSVFSEDGDSVLCGFEDVVSSMTAEADTLDVELPCNLAVGRSGTELRLDRPTLGMATN
jgi:hypothetical protein